MDVPAGIPDSAVEDDGVVLVVVPGRIAVRWFVAHQEVPAVEADRLVHYLALDISIEEVTDGGLEAVGTCGSSVDPHTLQFADDICGEWLLTVADTLLHVECVSPRRPDLGAGGGHTRMGMRGKGTDKGGNSRPPTEVMHDCSLCSPAQVCGSMLKT